MCHPQLPLDILGILEPDLTIGALHLVHHIPAQGAAILQRIPEVGGDGVRHDALLHRALEENAVGAVGAVRDDPAQRRHQRVREILGGVLRSQIAHVKRTAFSMNSLRLLQFASSIHASMRRMTLGRSQIVVHFLLSSIFLLPFAAIGQNAGKPCKRCTPPADRHRFILTEPQTDIGL